MTTDWHAYLEEDELGRGFVYIQKAQDKRRRQTHGEFSPSEMEEHREMVEAVLQEAQLLAHNRNSQ